MQLYHLQIDAGLSLSVSVKQWARANLSQYCKKDDPKLEIMPIYPDGTAHGLCGDCKVLNNICDVPQGCLRFVCPLKRYI